MKYQKQQSIGGAWVKGADVVSGTHCKLMSATERMPSQFKDEKTSETKYQDVAKVLFSGDSETKNISLNRATINASWTRSERIPSCGRIRFSPPKPRRW